MVIVITLHSRHIVSIGNIVLQFLVPVVLGFDDENGHDLFFFLGDIFTEANAKYPRRNNIGFRSKNVKVRERISHNV